MNTVLFMNLKATAVSRILFFFSVALAWNTVKLITGRKG